jgi:hypothetical protein
MSNVLILGGRAPVALDHARRFFAQGWTVTIADSASCRVSAWSNAVAATVRVASPRHAPVRFIADLLDAIRRHRIDLIVPTCEEVFFLSRYRAALPATCRIVVDDFDKLRLLHSKWDFLQLAASVGGNPPDSALITDLDQAREWAGGKGIVLKPEYSRFGVHIRIYAQGVPKNAPALPPLGRWVAQEYYDGVELCSYSVAERGRLTAHALYRPLHRLHRSSSYYFEPHICAPIQDFVARLIEKLQFTGQISFDWIDVGDGRPRVLECNPRTTSGVHLFSMDDPLPSALDGKMDRCVFPQAGGPRMLAPIMYTAGLLQSLCIGDLRRWRDHAQRANDVITAPGDFSPVVGALVDMGWFAKTALRRRCTLREAATSDIEWDGEELSWT